MARTDDRHGTRAGVGAALRACALVVATLLGSAGVTGLFLRLTAEQWQAVTGPALADPADVLLLGCCLSGAALTAWLGLGSAAAALATLPGAWGRFGDAIAARIAPAAVRRLVGFLLGTTLVAAFAPGTAVALGPGTPAGWSPTAARSAALLLGADASSGSPVPAAADPGFHPTVADPIPAPEPGFTPLPAPTVPTSLGPLGPAAGSPDAERYIVRAGDCLWDIAARHLGPSASAQQVAAAWPLWYAANRAVIGADPDALEPGQALVIPAPALVHPPAAAAEHKVSR